MKGAISYIYTISAHADFLAHFNVELKYVFAQINRNMLDCCKWIRVITHNCNDKIVF